MCVRVSVCVCVGMPNKSNINPVLELTEASKSSRLAFLSYTLLKLLRYLATLALTATATWTPTKECSSTSAF